MDNFETFILLSKLIFGNRYGKFTYKLIGIYFELTRMVAIRIPFKNGPDFQRFYVAVFIAWYMDGDLEQKAMSRIHIIAYPGRFPGWRSWSLSCSVTKSYLTLCDPMDCSTPGFPVLQISWSLLRFH